MVVVESTAAAPLTSSAILVELFVDAGSETNWLRVLVE